MKRFFLCCVIVITALFLGFTVYYCVQNNEKIAMASNSSSIKLNVGDKFNMSDIIVHTLPHNDTVLNVEFSVGDVLEYDSNTKQFEAKKIGSTVLTITPSNVKYGPFIFNVTVGDGSSSQYPYFIRTADELCSIGSTLPVTYNYELIADIYLTDRTWTPIAEYGAVFNGGNHVIYDMKVTSATNAGLFGIVAQTGVVKNVTFINANLNGSFETCGVVAGINHGIISLCQVIDSTITNGGNYTGAIAGQNVLTPLTSGAISARIGMCGVETTTITASHKIGGITALNQGSIVENSYVALPSVKGSSTGSFGGIVGENIGYAPSGNAYEKASTIYKCHAYVQEVSNTTLTSGIAFLNSNVSTVAPNVYVYNYFCIPTSNYIGSTQSASPEQIEKVSDTQLKEQTTYATWDFNQVWKMADNYAVINYTMPYVTCVSDTTVVNEIVTPTPTPTPDPEDPTPSYTNEITYDNFNEKMAEIKANPNSGKTYVIKTTFTISSPTNIYYPLGTPEKPYTCQIIAYNNCYITISNLTLNNVSYASMFGYVGSNGYISGFKYVNANITCSSTNCGVVSAELCSGAVIQGCQVSNSTLNGSNNVGFICGYNAGTIKSASISSSTLNVTGNACAGIAVGYNSGSVESATSANCAISSTSGTGSFGGIVGDNSGSISNATVTSFNGTASSGNVYLGAIAGKNSSSTNSSTSTSTILNLSLNQATAYAGGITGFNSGYISKCKSLNSSITAYYAGGLSALNSGNISQSIAGTNNQGSVSGVYAGGLTAINQTNATIDNCLVGTQMVTTSASVNTCGMAYKLEEGSIINNCFSYATFSGTNGQLFCDTSSAFRNFYSGAWSIIPGNYKMGIIQNSLMLNKSNTTILGGGLLPDAWDSAITDVQVSEQEARGSDNFAKFYSNGFSSSVWYFISGQYPTIK